MGYRFIEKMVTTRTWEGPRLNYARGSQPMILVNYPEDWDLVEGINKKGGGEVKERKGMHQKKGRTASQHLTI